MANKFTLQDITKSFGSLKANDKINITIQKNQIHAVIGENGAGKSTAMKILYGMYPADAGSIRADDKPVTISSPSDALDLGIGMVHQHFMLSGRHTAFENIILGTESFFPHNRTESKSRIQKIMDDFSLHVPLNSLVETLSVGEQQRIEILKLLYRNLDFLILDEPSAVLSPQEIIGLYKCLRLLAESGKAIVVITHKLKEVLAYTDEISILRAGKLVAKVKSTEATAELLTELMIGKKLTRSNIGDTCAANSKELISFDDFSDQKLKHLNFKLFGGQILGVAGIEGNGQSELFSQLLQLTQKKYSSGQISIMGLPLEKIDPINFRSLGIGVLAPDRLHDSLIPELSVLENIALGYEETYATLGWIDFKKLFISGNEILEKHDVRPRKLEIDAGRLSGGNQQKLVVGRELFFEPKILIAAQPTRGVDVLAAQSIHDAINSVKQKGGGVLLISSELDELLSLSDRIIVLREGQIVDSLVKSEFDENRIGAAMLGANPK